MKKHINIINCFLLIITLNCSISTSQLRKENPKFYNIVTSSSWIIFKNSISTENIGKLKFEENGALIIEYESDELCDKVNNKSNLTLLINRCKNAERLNNLLFKDSMMYSNSSKISWEPVKTTEGKISSNAIKINLSYSVESNKGNRTEDKYLTLYLKESVGESKDLLKKSFVVNSFDSNSAISKIESGEFKESDDNTLYFVNSEKAIDSYMDSDKENYRDHYRDNDTVMRLIPNLNEFITEEGDTQLKIEEKKKRKQIYLEKFTKDIYKQKTKFYILDLNNVKEEKELTLKGKKIKEEIGWIVLNRMSGNRRDSDMKKIEDLEKALNKEYTGNIDYKAHFKFSNTNKKLDPNFRTIDIFKSYSKSEALKLDKNKKYSIESNIYHIKYGYKNDGNIFIDEIFMK